MLITGCSNSLWSKWQDMQCVENCDDPQGRIYFEQPVWQTLNMFLGEFACFLPILWAHWRDRNASAPLIADDHDADPAKLHHRGLELSGWKRVIFWAPAACDLTGTTLMNIGLLMTPVSIFQMTRGALVLWVGIFSVMFLRRKLYLYQWLSLMVVMIGVSIVGLSGSLIKKALSSPDDVTGKSLYVRVMEDDPAKVFVGVLFILFAQLFTATQFVIEEKIMAKYSVEPLEAVGLEGFFGCISVLMAMPFLYLFKDQSTWFDLPRGWDQMVHTPTVLWASAVIAVSIGLFNFFGLSVTRHVSATARSTIDTCRTLGIWLISLGLGWEKLSWPFSVLQVIGFGLLVYGTFVFNNLVLPPSFIRHTPSVAGEPNERTSLLHNEEDVIRAHLDETAALPSDLGRSGYDVVPPPTRGQN
ncbi:hypothetical protein FRC03_010808 [Tulasnella sp. 419]|nr:hypothetical protein FRC02_003987 [Tulasnella sp. 418]KAG8967060.1 hypothetical protein FRC03_010808 [Tulasnella sp. 419]